jgi:hypothetical protein
MIEQLTITIEADSKQELYAVKEKLIAAIADNPFLNETCKLVFFQNDLLKNAQLEDLNQNWNMGFIDRETYEKLKKRFS